VGVDCRYRRIWLQGVLLVVAYLGTDIGHFDSPLAQVFVRRALYNFGFSGSVPPAELAGQWSTGEKTPEDEYPINSLLPVRRAASDKETSGGDDDDIHFFAVVRIVRSRAYHRCPQTTEGR
jgi:hypothetical protein